MVFFSGFAFLNLTMNQLLHLHFVVFKVRVFSPSKTGKKTREGRAANTSLHSTLACAYSTSVFGVPNSQEEVGARGAHSPSGTPSPPDWAQVVMVMHWSNPSDTSQLQYLPSG